jgi:hypothetical protein
MGKRPQIDKTKLKDLKGKYGNLIATSRKISWDIWVAVIAGLIVGIVMYFVVSR